jgi:hypothetical protein
MKTILKILSFAGLLLTLVPSLMVFAGTIEITHHKTLMLLGTFLWFTTAPFWLGRQVEPDHNKS